MVYTVTFNPALDYVMNVRELSTADINRTVSEELHYGGKGINVSAILSRLNIPTVALGFAGGFTGEKLCDMMNSDKIKNDFVRLSTGDTRINVKIKYGRELDINAVGPKIPHAKVNELFDKLKSIEKDDYLVLAGSVPKTLPDSIYSEMLKALSEREIRAVVDTTGNQLLNALEYKPFLIKPNHHELGELFGQAVTETDDIIKYAKELKKMGAQNVLVSRGADGAVLVDENNEVHIAKAVEGKLVSSVGCGDSMVAGFIAGMSEKEDYSYAFKLSLATSAATAFSKELATADEIKKIFQKI